LRPAARTSSRVRLPALLAVVACALVGTPAVAAPEGAPSVVGEAGRAAVVVLRAPVATESISVRLSYGRAGGVFVRRLDGPAASTATYGRYYDGYRGGGSPIAHWHLEPERLPAGRYAVHLLGVGQISVDLDDSRPGPTVRPTRRFEHRLDARDVELSEVSPGRWKGGIYDELPPAFETVAGIHLEGRNLVGDSDYCQLGREHETCDDATPQRELVPRWLTPQTSSNVGRHDVRFTERRLGDRTVVSYDGVTPPERLVRTLLQFRPLSG
jgi:hypothetical protein